MLGSGFDIVRELIEPSSQSRIVAAVHGLVCRIESRIDMEVNGRPPQSRPRDIGDWRAHELGECYYSEDVDVSNCMLAQEWLF